jgi:hypothetical protein
VTRYLLVVLLSALVGCARGADSPPGADPVVLDPQPLSGDEVEWAGEAPMTSAPQVGEIPAAVAPGIVAGRLPIKVSAGARLEPQGATSLREVGYVTAYLDLSQLDGAADVVLEIQTPDGTPFQRNERQIRATLQDTTRVEFKLPVAGTLIQRKRMTGTWSAQFLVDGQPLAVTTFDLQQERESR